MHISPFLFRSPIWKRRRKHAEGFATECAVVTHHRLEAQKDESGKTKLVPTGELSEPLIIRPTSENPIIGAAFARWIESYRDLPLLINQWANVMRWEMRPRLFYGQLNSYGRKDIRSTKRLMRLGRKPKKFWTFMRSLRVNI